MMWSRSPSWIGNREKPDMATAPITSSAGVSTSRASISIRGRMMSLHGAVAQPQGSAGQQLLGRVKHSLVRTGVDQVFDVFQRNRLVARLATNEHPEQGVGRDQTAENDCVKEIDMGHPAFFQQRMPNLMITCRS